MFNRVRNCIWQSIKFIVDTIAQTHLVLTFLFVCCFFLRFLIVESIQYYLEREQILFFSKDFKYTFSSAYFKHNECIVHVEFCRSLTIWLYQEIGYLQHPCHPAGDYMFIVNNKNFRKRCEIHSKLTIKTPERRQWRQFVQFKLTLNIFHTLFQCFYC